MLQTPQALLTLNCAEVSYPRGLTSLQWTVVHLATREAVATRSRAYLNRFLGMMGIAAGWRRKSRLADAGLEALRQFVCLSRERDQRACDLVPDLLETGLDVEAIAAIACLSIKPLE